MAFKTPDLVSYFEQAQSEGQSQASIISSLFGLVAGGIAKMKAAPIPYAPGVKPTPEPKPLMPGLVAGLTPPPVMMTPPPSMPVSPISQPAISADTTSTLLQAIGQGCKYNPQTKAFT